jgi:phage shock protein C
MSRRVYRRSESGSILQPGRKLLRKRGSLTGVAAGIADYFGWNPTVVRLAFMVGVFFKGFGLLAYLILAGIMPKERSEDTERETLFSDRSLSSHVKENVFYEATGEASEHPFEDVRIVCSNCETLGKSHSNFCHKCGKPLT